MNSDPHRPPEDNEPYIGAESEAESEAPEEGSEETRGTAPTEERDGAQASPPEEEAIRRLHPSSMLFEALRQARSLASAAVVPGVALLFGSGLSAWVISLILIGAVVLVVFSAVRGFLSWRMTTYAVRGGAFYLKRGILQKNERTIPLDHVQSVDTVQGFVQRGLSAAGVLDVVEVRIETAGGGSGETDATLTALTREEATALRREVERTRRDRAGVSPDEEEPQPTVIRKLTTRELLAAGATSGQIGATAAIIAFASQFFDDAIERFFSERFVNDFVQAIAPSAVVVVALVVLVLGLFAWLLSIAGTVLSYAGFTLSRSPDGKYLNIRRGLIKRYEATVPISRVQAIRLSEGLFRQPFGLAMLHVESAGYGSKAEDSGVSTTLFPLLPRREVAGLLEEILPELAVFPTLNPVPRRALRRYVLRSTLPFLAIAGIAAVPLTLTDLMADFLGYYAAGTVALLALSALYGWAAYRAAGWAFEGDCFVARSRSLARTTSVASRRRLQSRSVVRNPFQRRLDLATIRARVASGGGGATFEVVDIESEEAEALIPALGPRRRRFAGG